MKRRILYVLFLLCTVTLSVQSQHMETDIPSDLVYRHQTNNYKAYLRNNIFENLVFTDTRNNSIKMDKSYCTHVRVFAALLNQFFDLAEW
ncbi:hypothetical protein PQ465_14935 [Sphingobacterium oryzagri]|uniref:Uncharacterized protein n=1 Tax=Sphingobacterium oryzagri TaxID=3025669 RepID=A0ABY7WD61_9SPHI|nr:hypothetical protein [Sphingobacterium sp. KACC 22765]WDF67593.1 hypothetical protein PQ465_14935 [Sphingobacterium sp. KACC 22765]